MKILDDTREERKLTVRETAPAKPSPHEPGVRTAPHALLAMLNALDEATIEQIERVLNSELNAPTRPAEERERLLGALIARRAELGASPARADYDQHRPEGSAPSHVLVKTFGSWVRACRAAATEEAQGAGEQPARPLRPWPNPTRGRRRPADYTREEILRAVLRCAEVIGRIPTSNAYYGWVARQRRHARESGAETPRLPTQRSVERHFKGWGRVLETVEALPGSLGAHREPRREERPW